MQLAWNCIESGSGRDAHIATQQSKKLPPYKPRLTSASRCHCLRAQGSSAQERMAAAGGVSEVHIRAIKSLLEDPHFDGECSLVCLELGLGSDRDARQGEESSRRPSPIASGLACCLLPQPVAQLFLTHLPTILLLLLTLRRAGSFKAMAITLPSDSELIDAVPGTVEPLAIHEVRAGTRRSVGSMSNAPALASTFFFTRAPAASYRESKPAPDPTASPSLLSWALCRCASLWRARWRRGCGPSLRRR